MPTVIEIDCSTGISTEREMTAEGNATTNIFMMIDSGLWRNTSAITSVQFFHQGTAFLTNSTIRLYGIKKTA
jgi:glucan biosynthesis protein